MKAKIIGKSVISIFGLEVTKPELIIIASGTILLPFLVPVYSLNAGLHWTILQTVIAYGIAFDIISGCLVYNSFHHKRIGFLENGMVKNTKHALLHMQPLVVASFFTEELLLYIGIYWFLMYILFVSLFEPYSRVSKKFVREWEEKAKIMFFGSKESWNRYAQKCYSKSRTTGSCVNLKSGGDSPSG